MLGDHEFSDGAVDYTDAYSAYGPIVAGKSGIWWFTLRNRWDPGARYMPAEWEVLNAARDRHQHWELITEAVPAALLRELCQATAISCPPVLEAEDGLAGWRYRIPPCTAIARRAPSAGGGQFWLVLAGDAAVDGGDPLPANSCIFVSPEDPAFAGASGPVGAELLHVMHGKYRGLSHRVDYHKSDWLRCPQTQFEVRFTRRLQLRHGYRSPAPRRAVASAAAEPTPAPRQSRCAVRATLRTMKAASKGDLAGASASLN